MNQKHQQNKYHVSVNASLMIANETQIKSGTMINVAVSVKIQKSIICSNKSYLGSCYTSSCKNGKYLGSIIDNSVDISDDIKDTTKTVPTKMYKVYKMLKK